MRVGFAGTPVFAARALSAIHRNGFTIPLVLTQPDRPSGRGLAVAPSAVKRLAADFGLAVRQPPTLRAPGLVAELAATPLDVLVVAAYGLILPQPVLAWPRHGCLNIHASLLPRWRGAAPIARAIEAGDQETGVTIMQMDEGLDTGPVVARARLAIASGETTGELTERLADLGARVVVETLAMLQRDGSLPGSPQPAEGVTYAPKIGRADTLLDWSSSASALDRRIRAMAPAPGAVAAWEGMPVKVRAASPLAGRAAEAPGTVVAVSSQGIDIACGHDDAAGLLRLLELQPAGGRPMAAHAFAIGRGVAPGKRFGPGR
ncbi:MAG: methionyl-tRNA formyltransferase [Rudaea sp.]